jgi:3-dehydroquinate dehydratase I
MTDSKVPKIVGVIFSRADFQCALRMRNPPDLFELRLDRLAPHLPVIENAIARLAAPLILTARHPREGGANNLTSRERRDLLLAFLPRATYVDLELRSAASLGPVVQSARAAGVGLIVSIHDLKGTPPVPRLEELAGRARSLGADLVKIATRTDTRAQLDRLLDFFERQRHLPNLAAMGIGKLGRVARVELARRGSVLNYGHLGSAVAAGQLSIRALRALV